jgi:hypothetical protein
MNKLFTVCAVCAIFTASSAFCMTQQEYARKVEEQHSDRKKAYDDYRTKLKEQAEYNSEHKMEIIAKRKADYEEGRRKLKAQADYNREHKSEIIAKRKADYDQYRTNLRKQAQYNQEHKTEIAAKRRADMEAARLKRIEEKRGKRK